MKSEKESCVENETPEPEWIQYVTNREPKYLGFVKGELKAVPVKDAYWGFDPIGLTK